MNLNACHKHCDRISAAIKALGFPAPVYGERNEIALDKIATCLEMLVGATEPENVAGTLGTPEGEDDPSCPACSGHGMGGYSHCSHCGGSGLEATQ